MFERYRQFQDLPEWVKTPMQILHPRDSELAIFRQVPALGDESIISLLNQGEDAVAKAQKYIVSAMARLATEIPDS